MRDMTTVSEYVRSLALKHQVSYQRNRLDAQADTITELSGDKVGKDATLDLLIALKRSGVATKSEVAELTAKHPHELKLIRE